MMGDSPPLSPPPEESEERMKRAREEQVEYSTLEL